MMLGGRFDVGADLPVAVSADLLARLRDVEAQLTDHDRASKRWTLSWLEGRPVLTLDGGPRLEER